MRAFCLMMEVYGDVSCELRSPSHERLGHPDWEVCLGRYIANIGVISFWVAFNFGENNDALIGDGFGDGDEYGEFDGGGRGSSGVVGGGGAGAGCDGGWGGG